MSSGGDALDPHGRWLPAALVLLSLAIGGGGVVVRAESVEASGQTALGGDVLSEDRPVSEPLQGICELRAPTHRRLTLRLPATLSGMDGVRSRTLSTRGYNYGRPAGSGSLPEFSGREQLPAAPALSPR